MEPSEAKKIAQANDLTTVGLFTRLGGGVNKQAYRVGESSWILLITGETKSRILTAEVEQLLALVKDGVETPKMGATTLEEAIFQVQLNRQSKIAFLEEAIDGFEIERLGTAFSEDNVRAFGVAIVNDLSKLTDLNEAKQKRKAALGSVEKLKARLKKKDIPDFQVRYDRATGRILTLDPGDPENSENAPDKHLRWLSLWEKVLSDCRYLASEWNKNHAEATIKPTDW